MTEKHEINIVSGQNFACTNCGRCCQHWRVALRSNEPEKIAALSWPAEQAAVFSTTPIITEIKGHPFLAHNLTGNCIFWDEAACNCRIHAEFGFAAKPLACRVYPLNITSSFPGTVSVAARFDCPAIQQNGGPPLPSARPAIEKYVKELGINGGFDHSDCDNLNAPTVRFLCSQFTELIVDRPQTSSTLRNLLFALTVQRLAGLGEHFLNDLDTMKQVLSPLTDRVETEIREIPGWPAPGKFRRTAFRLWLGWYLRRDQEIFGKGVKRRLQRFKAHLHLISGDGSLVELGSENPDLSLNQAGILDRDYPTEKSPRMFSFDAELEQAWECYWRSCAAKLETFQFFGPTYYGASFFEGLRAMVQTYALVLAVAKVQAVVQKRQVLLAQDVQTATGIVDHSFGRSALLGMRIYRSVEKYFDGPAYGHMLATLERVEVNSELQSALYSAL